MLSTRMSKLVLDVLLRARVERNCAVTAGHQAPDAGAHLAVPDPVCYTSTLSDKSVLLWQESLRKQYRKLDLSFVTQLHVVAQ